MDTPQEELRQVAAKAGRKRFLGSVCRRCSKRERYVSNGGCIACAMMREALRRQAIRALMAESRRG